MRAETQHTVKVIQKLLHRNDLYNIDSIIATILYHKTVCDN